MEFLEILALDSIPATGWRGTIAAPDDTLAEIAQRVDAPEVIRLRGELEIRMTAHGVRLSGVLDAAVIRECVASLELFEETIREPFELEFSRRERHHAQDEAEIDPDAPEPLSGESIDLADIIVQQLSLAMAPYPRKPGATSLAEKFAPPAPVSPFAALKSKIAEGDDQG